MTGPVVARLIPLALAVPPVAALFEATTTSGAQSRWVIVGVVVVFAGVGTIRRQSPHRRSREQIFDGVRTGVPSGEPEIDAVIEDRLAYAAYGGRVTQILGLALLAAIFTTPAVAAFRVNVWWLAAYAVLPLYACGFPVESYTDPAPQRLARFREAWSRAQ